MVGREVYATRLQFGSNSCPRPAPTSDGRGKRRRPAGYGTAPSALVPDDALRSIPTLNDSVAYLFGRRQDQMITK